MTNNGQTPGGNTTTAGAVEQLAQDIANRLHPITGHAWSHCYRAALAAIIETTEAAAKHLEDQPSIHTLGGAWRQDIAAALRNNDHLKGPKP